MNLGSIIVNGKKTAWKKEHESSADVKAEFERQSRWEWVKGVSVMVWTSGVGGAQGRLCLAKDLTLSSER